MVFEKIMVEPRVAVNLLLSQWEEIERCDRSQVMPACSRRRGEGDKFHEKWVNPPFQTIKFNCARAWHKQTGRGDLVGWLEILRGSSKQLEEWGIFAVNRVLWRKQKRCEQQWWRV